MGSPTAGEAPTEIQMNGETMRLLVEAPCCGSRRQCLDTNKYIIDVSEKRIIETIPAVRCNRGLQRIYEVEIAKEKANSVVIVEHYISNRGVNYLYFEIPRTPTPEIMSIVREILGLTEVRKIVVR